MHHPPYPEPDDVLAARHRLALIKSYSLVEAVCLNNRLNVFDTMDGYRVTLIKERDPVAFGFEHPVLHVSMQTQAKATAIIPKTEAGRLALAARLLVRLGMSVGEHIQIQARGTAVHVWFMVAEWADQLTHPQLEDSSRT